MILPFSTQLNGKPTYFVEKIWSSLMPKYAEPKYNPMRYILPQVYFECIDKGFLNMNPHNAKYHTIREDKKERWKPGRKIDFFINCRQKSMFRFAPVLPVVSVQKVTMSYLWGKVIMITIAGREMYPSEKEQFAMNDGFDNWESFFEYFYDVIKNTEDNFFTGKIIHWTDLKY